MYSPLMIGGPEWIWIILLAGMLLFGTKKVPEMARGIGKAMGEFQRGKAEIEREIRLSSKTEYDTQPQELSITKQELQKSAAALGIDSTTKSEDELRDAIKRKLDS